MASFWSPRPRQVRCYWPEKVTVTLFGNGVFVDIIRMRSYRSRIGPNSMTGVLIKRERFGDRQIPTEGEQPREDGEMWLQAKECQGRSAATRSWEGQGESAPRALRENMALPTSGSVFWPPDCERIISAVSATVCGTQLCHGGLRTLVQDLFPVDPSLRGLLDRSTPTISLWSLLFLFCLSSCHSILFSHRPLGHTRVPHSSRKPSMTGPAGRNLLGITEQLGKVCSKDLTTN